MNKNECKFSDHCQAFTAEREFERQMRNYEEFGNIEGRVIYINGRRKDRAV